MTSFRIETFCATTGELQHVEVVFDPMEVLIFCTAPWRAASTHLVYMTTARGEKLFRAYTGGRLITPHLK